MKVAQPTADRQNNWRNDKALKNATDILAAGLDHLKDQITINGMINVLLIESADLLSESIWLQKKNFEWDPRDPHTEFFSEKYEGVSSWT